MTDSPGKCMKEVVLEENAPWGRFTLACDDRQRHCWENWLLQLSGPCHLCDYIWLYIYILSFTTQYQYVIVQSVAFLCVDDNILPCPSIYVSITFVGIFKHYQCSNYIDRFASTLVAMLGTGAPDHFYELLSRSGMPHQHAVSFQRTHSDAACEGYRADWIWLIKPA